MCCILFHQSADSGSLGDPFSRPLGSGGLASGGGLLAPLSGSGLLKLDNVELGAVDISNQYEEEEEEEDDDSDKESEDESDMVMF